jgi:hypothetical protein
MRGMNVLYSFLSRAPHRCYFFVRPLGGSSIRFCSSFSACSASISNCFCSCLKLAFMARSWAPAALSAHLRASCRRCSARVVITGRTLLAVGHRGGRRKNASPLQPAPGSNAKPLAWLRASSCSRPAPIREYQLRVCRMTSARFHGHGGRSRAPTATLVSSASFSQYE